MITHDLQSQLTKNPKSPKGNLIGACCGLSDISLGGIKGCIKRQMRRNSRNSTARSIELRTMGNHVMN